jgi:hypothetical protein
MPDTFIELTFPNNILDWDILQEVIDKLALAGGGTIWLKPLPAIAS